MVRERRLCREHADEAAAQLHRESDAAQERFELDCAEAVDVFVQVMNGAGDPGCKGSYDTEGRRGSKTRKVKGWLLGPRTFVMPDGTIYVPPHERWGGGTPSIGGRKRVEQHPETSASGEQRGAWVAGLFKDGVSRDGSGPFSPIERLSELLAEQGLSWPSGYQPPTDTPAGISKRIIG